MKKSALVLIGILLLQAGCGNGTKETTLSSAMDIPENVHILYNVEEIEAPKEAGIYDGEYIQVDLDLLQEYFLHDEIAERGVDAFGRYVHTQAEDGTLTEVLYAYDGGAEADIYSGVDGGFFYRKCIGNIRYYGDIVSMSTGHPDNIQQIYGYNSIADFLQWEDLDFISLDEAAAMIEEAAVACGLPKMQLDTVYALDVATLQKHNKMMTEHSNDAANVDWQTEDEAYLFFYEQRIDGIPVINHMWEPGTLSVKTYLCPYAYVLLSSEGILDVEMRGWVDLTGSEEMQTLLTPTEAEKLLLEEYGKSLQIAETYVEDLELNYVGLVNGEGWKLVPAWVFCIAKEITNEYPDLGENVTVKAYEHYVINAVTGEHIIASGGSEN